MGALFNKWQEVIDRQNSIVCAGLDPADFGMGRGEKGLPEGMDRHEWALRYVTTVAPFVAAIKPNVQYWKHDTGMRELREIVELAHRLGLLVIDDSKLADIGDTNDAGIYQSADKGFDAVTIAPYAGNMQKAQEQAEKHGIAAITMCLMSNDEYEKVKSDWVEVDDPNGYEPGHIIDVEGVPHTRKYIQLAHDADVYGIEGIVIGASRTLGEGETERLHPTDEEIAIVRQYFGDEQLVL